MWSNVMELTTKELTDKIKYVHRQMPELEEGEKQW